MNEKVGIILIVLFIATFTISIVYFGFEALKEDEQDINIINNTLIFNYDNENLTKRIEMLERKKPIFLYSFEKTAYNFASERDYILDEYDCKNYSDELERRLDQEGYDSRTIDGKFYYENGTFKGFHRWVEVKIIIEATTGDIVPVEDYWRYKG